MLRLLFFVLLLQCASQDSPDPKEIIPKDIVETPVELVEPALKESEIILKVQNENESYAGLFTGLLHDALGDEALAAGDKVLAEDYYFRALANLSEAFVLRTFPKLIRVLIAAKSNTFTAESLSLYLQDKMSSAEAKTSLSYIERSKKKSLTAYLDEEYGTELAKLGPDSGEKPGNVDSLVLANPKSDPVLNRMTAQYCQQTGQNRTPPADSVFAVYKEPLVDIMPKYWRALERSCDDKPTSIRLLQEFLQATAEEPAISHIRLNAARKIVEIYRAEGNREDLPQYYLQAANLWDGFKGSAKDLGMQALEFEFHRINDKLWTARYRSLIGDYELASKYANAALRDIANVYSKHKVPKGQQQIDLATYRAEAYHILAFRIALEKQQYESAIANSKLALQTPHLTLEWQQILNWNLGLYYFLTQDFKDALAAWQKIHGKKPIAQWDDRELYWVARAHVELKQASQAKPYLEVLAAKHPLGFYNIVAAFASGKDMIPEQLPYLAPRSMLVDNFADFSNLQIQDLRSHQVVGPHLARTELLLNYGLIKQAAISYEDLEAGIRKSFSVRDRPSAYVYLTRIAHAAGLYKRSIQHNEQVMNHQLNFWSTWPEQILLSFPRPYTEMISRRTLETGVEPETILAITRQESLFDHNAASPAGAYGLMQIIPETANRISSQLGIDLKDPAKDLLNPDYNLQIGAHYLRQLSRHYEGFNPAIYAAYNAGEAAVDAWMKRRYHKDAFVWIELIPYGETRNYVKKVWRNFTIYQRLTYDERLVQKQDGAIKAQ